MTKIVVISGATSSGKSKLAIDFVEKIRNKQESVIINADSLQFYQGLPILSAQPSKEEQEITKHRLYSQSPVENVSSVANWLKLVKIEVDQAIANKEMPIIVGGTGMYICALMDGLSPIREVDPKIRQIATQYLDENGIEDLQNKLISLGDKKIIDRQRLIRAYEVYLDTGKTITYFQNQPKEKTFKNANFIHLNLEIDRAELYKNCNSRFDKMIEGGALSEVQILREKIKDNIYPVTNTLGYLEICQYLDGKISKEEMAEIVTKKTRNYAKRQLTWFRNQIKDKQVCNNSSDSIKYLTSCINNDH